MSPLILTSKELEGPFLEVLAKLCPGIRVQVDADRVVRLDERTSCANYCPSRAGCHLLERVLRGRAAEVLVKFGRSEYRPRGPDGLASPWLAWGRGRATPPGLAHELIHALHDLDGTYRYDDNDEEERCTTCQENQVRVELGLPPRRVYNPGEPLGCGVLVGGRKCERLNRVPRRRCSCPRQLAVTEDMPDVIDFGTADCLAEFAHLYSDRSSSLLHADKLRCRFRSGLEISEPVRRLLDGAKRAIMLERVNVNEASYSLALIVGAPGWARVFTSVDLYDRPAFVGNDWNSGEAELPPSFDAVLRGALSTPPLSPLAEVMGTEPYVCDATTTFLTTLSDGQSRRAALHGYAYEGFDLEPLLPHEPADDAAAWHAIRAAIDLWRRAVVSGVRRR